MFGTRGVFRHDNYPVGSDAWMESSRKSPFTRRPKLAPAAGQSKQYSGFLRSTYKSLNYFGQDVVVATADVGIAVILAPPQAVVVHPRR